MYRDSKEQYNADCLATETGTRKWYRFFSARFSYQLRLVSKFLVPETNMADDTVAVGAVGILVAIAAKEKENRKRKRTIWMQPWIANRETRHMVHTMLFCKSFMISHTEIFCAWTRVPLRCYSTKWHRIFGVRTLRCD